MRPVIGGYEAVRRIRLRQTTAGLRYVPIVGLTASAIEGDRERCIAAGMDDYLAKPFTAKSLMAMVAHWAVVENTTA
jgi:CheY-like chemotaxis protein